MQVVIGLAGEMGSGKGAAAKYIREKYQGTSYRFSKIITKILDVLYLEHTRKNTAGISILLRKEFGDDVFSKAMMEDVKNDSADIIVIDGIRTESDIEKLRKIPNFKLLFIDADIEERYQRIVERHENPDDADKTFDEFEKEHELETESKIKEFKAKADFVIENRGTVNEFHQKLDDIITNIKNN